MFEKLSKPNFNQNIPCLIRYLLLRLRSSDKWKSDHAAERVKFFRGQGKQTMCFRGVGWKWRSRYIFGAEKAFQRLGDIQKHSQGFFQFTGSIPKWVHCFWSRRKVSFDSYAQISLLSLFTSLRRTAGLSKRIYFSRIARCKSHWRATKEISMINENLISESRSSFCFAAPLKTFQETNVAPTLESQLITKDVSLFKNSQRV